MEADTGITNHDIDYSVDYSLYMVFRKCYLRANVIYYPMNNEINLEKDQKVIISNI